MSARGRPRSFDRDVALQRAMEVFWAKGYEGAQVADLTAAMGVNPPSFYAAFGSKAAVFREAVDLYRETIGVVGMNALAGGRTARAGVEAMLRRSVEVAMIAPDRAGCLLMLGVVNSLPETEPLRDLLKGVRRATVDLIHKRLDRGVRDGELPAGTDTHQLATFYDAVLRGISLQARDGATREELLGTVAVAMAPLRGV